MLFSCTLVERSLTIVCAPLQQNGSAQAQVLQSPAVLRNRPSSGSASVRKQVTQVPPCRRARLAPPSAADGGGVVCLLCGGASTRWLLLLAAPPSENRCCSIENLAPQVAVGAQAHAPPPPRQPKLGRRRNMPRLPLSLDASAGRRQFCASVFRGEVIPRATLAERCSPDAARTDYSSARTLHLRRLTHPSAF